MTAHDFNDAKQQVECITMLFTDMCQQDLSIYDQRFLEKVVVGRSNVTKCSTGDDYYRLLCESDVERAAFLSSLNISYTEFFRNHLAFANLKQWIVPKIIKAKSQRDEIRVWSAGCSTGQEAYSIAMLLRQCMQQNQSDLIMRIFASDLSRENLTLAEKGEYQETDLGNVPLKYVREYFSYTNAKYKVSPKLQQDICFTQYDLLDASSYIPAESIYGNFDMIFCCNLLFYYRPEQQQQIIRKLIHALAPHGYLITGETERYIMSGISGLRIFAAPATIYQKTKMEDQAYAFT